jgi:hypothetical protein
MSHRGWQPTGCTVLLLYVFILVLHVICIIVAVAAPVLECHQSSDIISLQIWLLLTGIIGVVVWTIKVLAVLWCRHAMWHLFYRLLFAVNLVYQLLWISVGITLFAEGQVDCLRQSEGAAVMTLIMLLWESGTFIMNVLSRGVKPTVTQWMELE